MKLSQQHQQATLRPQRRPFVAGRQAVSVRCQSSTRDVASIMRRDVLIGAAILALSPEVRPAAAEPGMSMAESPVAPKKLCDEACIAALESKELVTLPSGLQYRDIIVGKGPMPPTGFQVVVNYDAMTPTGRIFDSSLEKGRPYDIRVGSGQVVAGLDEGLKTMQPGGLRRLYVPGNMAFPKGLKAAAGRPSVPPSSPVMFDVQLLYIPGLEADDE